MRGKKNSFVATLSKEGHKEVLYTVEGQWSDKFVLKEGKGKKEVRWCEIEWGNVWLTGCRSALTTPKRARSPP